MTLSLSEQAYYQNLIELANEGERDILQYNANAALYNFRDIINTGTASRAEHRGMEMVLVYFMCC